MDQLKNFASQVSGGQSGSSSTTTGNTAGAGQKEDYGDKALDFLEKKTGHTQSRETNEKITDKARDFFEKQTGKDIPDKFSN